MHELTKVLGGFVILAGAAGIALAVYLKVQGPFGTPPLPVIQTAIYGVSVFIAGVALYCLGSVADHLKAIREFQRRQVEIFERMGKNRASFANSAKSNTGLAAVVQHHDDDRPSGAIAGADD